MIGRERRGEGGTPLGAPLDTTEEKAFEVRTRVGRVRLSRRKAWVVISALVFAILLNMSIIEGDEANRCFAVLVFATLLWATEVRQSSLSCRFPSGGVLSQSSVGDTTFRNFYYDPCLTCLAPCDP
jgi:hypothetical protein